MLVLCSEAASKSHLDDLTQAGLAESAFEISSGVKSLDYFVFFIFFSREDSKPSDHKEKDQVRARA